MSFLVIDCESSDLIRKDVPLGDASQPWAVSVAADLCSDDGQSLAFFHTHIRSEGRAIKEGARAVHGISTRDAGRNGVSEVTAIGMLIGLAAQATVLVAHNVDFDKQLVESLLIRRGKDVRMWTRPGLTSCCTMLAAAPFCKLPTDHESGSYQWPSLDAACQIILGEKPREGAHSAWDDCQRAKRLFLQLRPRGALEAA